MRTILQGLILAGVDAGLPGATDAWALHQAHCGAINWLGANEENIVPRVEVP